MRSKNFAKYALLVFGVFILIVVLIVNLIPFFWGAITSLKTARELMVFPPKFIGFTASIEHYITVLKGTFSTAAFNSIIYSLISVFVGVIAAMMSGYALTRCKFAAKKPLFYIIICGIPLSMGSAAMVVPNYMLFSFLGMNNTFLTLPLIYIAYNIPMAVWIMVGGMQGVPYAIEEAAQIDGASKRYIIFSLVPSICKPTLACAALMIFIGAWNEYTVSSVLVNSQDLYPIQVSIYNYIGYFGREWGPLTAAATLAVIPVLIVFSFLGKMLISGLTAGAVKG